MSEHDFYCPWCGAAVDCELTGYTLFLCGSSTNRQADVCRIAQLEAENARLKEIVGKLPKGGELRLVAYLLGLACERFGNHGSKKLPEDAAAMLTNEEWLSLATRMEPEDPCVGLAKVDCFLMGYYADIFHEAAEAAKEKT